MAFIYNKQYLTNLYSSFLHRKYIDLRNRSIKKEVQKIIQKGTSLEIGFGNGNLLGHLREDFDVYGVDISNFAVEEIQKKYGSSNFKVCDVSKEKIPFNKEFDVIIALNVVEHFENPDFALRNIFNKLKKGGIFVIYLPIKGNILSNIQYSLLYDVEEHVFRPTVQTLGELLKKIGFRKYKELVGTLIPFGINIDSKFFLDSLNLYFGIWKK